MPVETRYMRNDTHTINGLLAYKLGTIQTAAALYVSTLATTPSLDSRLVPTSDIATQWVMYYTYSPPPTFHYQCVDEFPPNNATDGIVSNPAIQPCVDRFGHTVFVLGAGLRVAGVMVHARIKTDLGVEYEPVIRIGVRSGGVNYWSEELYTGGAWDDVYFWLEKDPATGLAWTAATINAAEIIVEGVTYSEDMTYLYSWCSAIYLEVYTYTDATIQYTISVWKRDNAGAETNIGTNIALWSAAISALHDSEGLKSGTWNCPLTALASTDSIVVRVYQRVGAGAWVLVRSFTTEQLGALQLDAIQWTVYYYLKIVATTAALNCEYYHGVAAFNSRITNFSWTPAAPLAKAGLNLAVVLPIIVDS